MKNKYLLLTIATLLILMPTIVSAGFFDDLKAFFENWKQYFQERQVEEQMGATVIYPYQGGTGTSTTPRMGDLLVGGNNNKYGIVSSSTDYYMLKVDTTAPYGLSWTGTIGGASNRLDAYLNTLNATTLTVSGGFISSASSTVAGDLTVEGVLLLDSLATGALDMGGHRIYHIGSASSTFDSVGGLIVNSSSTFTGDLSVGSNVLFVDESTGYVGIGTTGPTALGLHVSVPNSGGSAVIIEATGGTPYALEFKMPARTSARVYLGENNVLYWDGGMYPVSDNTKALGSTSKRWGSLRIGTSDSSFAGNVGIGTTTPETTLDIAGELRIGKNTTSTCSALIEGAIHFSKTDKLFWGCDGTSWVRLSP